MRVIFKLTDAERQKMDEGVRYLKDAGVKNPVAAYANNHGEHYAYDGKHGRILCGAPGKAGVYVVFDGQASNQYVGVPITHLEKE